MRDAGYGIRLTIAAYNSASPGQDVGREMGRTEPLPGSDEEMTQSRERERESAGSVPNNVLPTLIKGHRHGHLHPTLLIFRHHQNYTSLILYILAIHVNKTWVAAKPAQGYLVGKDKASIYPRINNAQLY